jgi:hypothetical protein
VFACKHQLEKIPPICSKFAYDDKVRQRSQSAATTSKSVDICTVYTLTICWMYSTIQPNRVTAQSPLEGVAVAKEVKSMFRNDLLSLKVPLKHVLLIIFIYTAVYCCILLYLYCKHLVEKSLQFTSFLKIRIYDDKVRQWWQGAATTSESVICTVYTLMTSVECTVQFSRTRLHRSRH